MNGSYVGMSGSGTGMNGSYVCMSGSTNGIYRPKSQLSNSSSVINSIREEQVNAYKFF